MSYHGPAYNEKIYFVTNARTSNSCVVMMDTETPRRLAGYFAKRFEARLAEMLGENWRDVVTRKSPKRWDAPLAFAFVMDEAAAYGSPYVQFSSGWLESFGLNSVAPEKAEAEKKAGQVLGWVIG